MLPTKATDEAIITENYVTYGEHYLEFAEETPFDVWAYVFEGLTRMEKSIRWWLGDAIRFGERKYGETYSQAIEATGYSYQTLANSVWVANQYPDPSLRQENLPFGHYEAAAAVDSKERAGLLQIAASMAWTQRQLREEVKSLREKEETSSLPVETATRIVCPHCNGTGVILAPE